MREIALFFQKNLNSWHKFYTTTCHERREKSQLCLSLINHQRTHETNPLYPETKSFWLSLQKKSRQDQTRHPISTFRPKGILIWSVDIDNPKVNGDTSIFDSIVLKS